MVFLLEVVTSSLCWKAERECCCWGSDCKSFPQLPYSQTLLKKLNVDEYHFQSLKFHSLLGLKCFQFFFFFFYVAVLFEISRILNTGLDMETLSICVRLCEQGINPEALSSVIKELRKATEALKVMLLLKMLINLFLRVRCMFNLLYFSL